MNWVVAEYEIVKGFTRTQWVSDPMTQSEAIRRAQAMNDAAPSDERWWQAARTSEIQGQVID